MGGVNVGGLLGRSVLTLCWQLYILKGKVALQRPNGMYNNYSLPAFRMLFHLCIFIKTSLTIPSST